MSQKTKIIVDHDAGTNPDDILALLFLLKSQNVEIALTVSGNNHPVERAQYVKRFFDLAGYDYIPCFAGEWTGHIDFYGYEAIRSSKYQPSQDYLTAIKQLCDNHENVIYLCIQNLANLYRLLKKYPDIAYKLRIYHMGMTLTGAQEAYIDGGTNMAGAPLEAKAVYEQANLDMHVIGAHTTIHDALRISPDTELHQKLKQSEKPCEQFIWNALREFYGRRKVWPALHDPLTASCAIGKNFVEFYDVAVDFNEIGAYRLGTTTNVTLSKSANHAGFISHFSSII